MCVHRGVHQPHPGAGHALFENRRGPACAALGQPGVERLGRRCHTLLHTLSVCLGQNLNRSNSQRQSFLRDYSRTGCLGQRPAWHAGTLGRWGRLGPALAEAGRSCPRSAGSPVNDPRCMAVAATSALLGDADDDLQRRCASLRCLTQPSHGPERQRLSFACPSALNQPGPRWAGAASCSVKDTVSSSGCSSSAEKPIVPVIASMRTFSFSTVACTRCVPRWRR